MFGFLDNRIVDIYALQNTEVVQNADGSTFDVVSYNLPEGSQVLNNFAKKTDADDFVTKIQDEILKIEGVAVIDLRATS